MYTLVGMHSRHMTDWYSCTTCVEAAVQVGATWGECSMRGRVMRVPGTKGRALVTAS